MKSRGYLVFHINLAFSSISEEERENVIRKCYHPLLDIIERNNISVGIELSGWTLIQMQRIDPEWVERLGKLIDSKNCELVGSGYCQIIGPLVPYKVNEWNQRLGRDIYENILNQRPSIALVNEMAFSQSLVDLYSQYNYKGLIVERNNIKLAINSRVLPTHTIGTNGSVLPILWSDSIMFQKMQHYAHGDISMNGYLDYFKKCLEDGDLLFPIYCNDAEVFDYRPGRFKEERPTHREGEWNRIENIVNKLKNEFSIDLVLPSEALEYYLEHQDKIVSKIVSTSYPVPVKKQPKYNIARWAVTGQNDSWLNTMCHGIHKHLIQSNSNNQDYWQQLCEIWSSDLRTHITEDRWIQAKEQVTNLQSALKVKEAFEEDNRKNESNGTMKTLESVLGSHNGVTISKCNESIFLRISTEKLKIELNLRRGLAIHELAFLSHQMNPCIGTLSHGFFDSISLGADFYSGNTIIELPLLRKRITDLDVVDPKFIFRENSIIEIHAIIDSPCGPITKVVSVSTVNETVSIKYDFSKFDQVYASTRLGIITLLNNFSDNNTKLMCSNGGKNDESFDFSGEFDHTEPASTLVSSSRGLGATTGQIKIQNNNKCINLQWDPSECAVMPMLSNLRSNSKTLSRIYFSMKEIDDTLKKEIKLIKNFSIQITS